MKENHSEGAGSPEPASNWQFDAEGQSAGIPSTPDQPQDETVTWVAQEFIAHEKENSWYGYLGIGAALLAVIVYFLTGKDTVSVGVVIVVAVVFGVLAGRKPRELEYSISHAGVSIGGKLYPFENFKSFSLNPEGSSGQSVWLLPLKRFMPIIPIYYPADQEDRIADALSQALPFENKEPDMVSIILHRLHF